MISSEYFKTNPPALNQGQSARCTVIHVLKDFPTVPGTDLNSYYTDYEKT